MIYGAASLSLTFLTALAPPIGWDTLVYHLTGPRFFVEAGRLIHPLDLPYLGFPQLGEMQFTLGLLLVGEGVAPLLHFGYGLLALAITVSLARRFFDVWVAWLAAALLLSVPTLFTLMTWAYVDATLLFYATSALYAFLRWRECREGGWLLISGLCCGFCGGVKYTAVVIPVALGLSLIWTSRRDGLRVIVRRLAFMALAAGGVVLPGLLENLLTTGNPVYPFLFSNGLHWDEWRRWWYDKPGTGLATTAPWRLLTAPLEATILGTEGTVLYEATIGPLLLPSLALLVLTWRSLDREKRAVAGHMLLFFSLK
jgi:4-amino-4-deoxy-L-arabinose transferase-like glycosyltransferase